MTGSRTPHPFAAAAVTFASVVAFAGYAPLAGAATPPAPLQLKQAEVLASKQKLATVKAALIRFEIDVARYPTTAEGLKALAEKPARGANGWKGPYLKQGDELKDAWGNDFAYVYPGVAAKPDSFKLSSAGPDGKHGTADDIVVTDE